MIILHIEGNFKYDIKMILKIVLKIIIFLF